MSACKRCKGKGFYWVANGPDDVDKEICIKCDGTGDYNLFKCPICNKEYAMEDSVDCEVCKKSVCPECISRQSITPDDFKDICISCAEDKYEGGR